MQSTVGLTQVALALPRVAKRAIAVVVDISLCLLSVWFAYYLRLGEFVSLTGSALPAVVAGIGLSLPIFVISGLYRAIFRYSGWPALLAVARAVGVFGVLYATVFTGVGVEGVPRTIGLIQPLLLLLLVGFSRVVARFWLGGHYRHQLKQASVPKVLIYGAGASGRQLAAAMSNSHAMRVVGFLDDDARLQRQVLNGIPIFPPDVLGRLVATREVSSVLLALPSISRRRRNEIIGQMQQAKVSVRTLPSFVELAEGKVGIADLRELDIDDLLGRDQVAPNADLLATNILGKVVLVSGAGGSIGSELCRQIVAGHPRLLLLLEQNEFGLYAIHQELLKLSPGVKVVPLLASVLDEAQMRAILGTWVPDTVYHAAAYKHVPLVEHNPAQGIRNNVFGTLSLARAALDHGVADFVLISTDKAVRPTNVMGASKRLAEMVLQALAQEFRTTQFTMVRFGNVLGSSGSVVPKFREQILNGGPITLTHPEITRYFMTIPEAAQLVIQAGAMAHGGDVFLLDMGQPVRIIDLARRMVELSGLTVKDERDPDGDIEIAVTGLRPGEKLYEELLIGDNPEATSHPRIMKAREDCLSWIELRGRLLELRTALDKNDVLCIRRLLQQLVSGYEPSSEIVDWVHLEQEQGADAPTAHANV